MIQRLRWREEQSALQEMLEHFDGFRLTLTVNDVRLRDILSLRYPLA